MQKTNLLYQFIGFAGIIFTVMLSIPLREILNN